MCFVSGLTLSSCLVKCPFLLNAAQRMRDTRRVQRCGKKPRVFCLYFKILAKERERERKMAVQWVETFAWSSGEAPFSRNSDIDAFVFEHYIERVDRVCHFFCTKLKFFFVEYRLSHGMGQKA